MADRDRTARLRPRTGLSRAVCHWRPVEDSRNLGDGRSSAGGAEDTALPTVLAVALAIFSFPLNVKPVLCNRRPGEIGRPRSSALARSGPLDRRAQAEVPSARRSDTPMHFRRASDQRIKSHSAEKSASRSSRSGSGRSGLPPGLPRPGLIPLDARLAGSSAPRQTGDSSVGSREAINAARRAGRRQHRSESLHEMSPAFKRGNIVGVQKTESLQFLEEKVAELHRVAVVLQAQGAARRHAR